MSKLLEKIPAEAWEPNPTVRRAARPNGVRVRVFIGVTFL